MTVEETIKALTLMDTMYPDTNADKSPATVRIRVSAWQNLFADEPFDLVMAALKAYMVSHTEHFAPSAGELKEEIRKLISINKGDEISEVEAWQYVSKALRNSSYGYLEEYQKLPECVQRAVGSPEQLQAWARMDEADVQQVIAPVFKKGFKTSQDRERETAKLPESTKAAIAELMNRLSGGACLTDGN